MEWGLIQKDGINLNKYFAINEQKEKPIRHKHLDQTGSYDKSEQTSPVEPQEKGDVKVNL